MATAKVYGLALQSALNAEIDFDTDTIKCMLTTASYVPDQDAHRYKSSVTNEVTGAGYTAGGTTLTGKTVTYTAGTNTFMIDAADPTWTTATISAIRYAVFYKDTGTAGTSPLLSYVDFTTDQAVGGGTFIVVLNAAGIATFTAA
jgi:hypothetical protein